MKCGLLGRKLGHSYSPQIHGFLGDYTYDLFEKEPEEIGDFLKNGGFSGINVTIPYKQAVIPFLDELSPLAEKLGAVNTIVRTGGRLIGHNTDYFGFLSMVEKSGLSVAGKKCLVLGSGGVSKPVVAALTELGGFVTVISHKENTPENLARHRDAAIIVNATPVGMYPNVSQSPVNLDGFPALEGVLDLIFNPAKTCLMLQAEGRGLVAMGGLWMLVAQAKEAAEWFTGRSLDDSVILSIYRRLRLQMENTVLIGMPGCGKSTLGRLLAEKLGKKFVDADQQVEAAAGCSIPAIFEKEGEEGFRRRETQVLRELGCLSGQVIATGGGCVTREENYPSLHRNGTIIWLRREIGALPTEGRPLSTAGSLFDMYQRREPLYRRFADVAVDNDQSPEQTAQAVIHALEGLL